MLAIGDNEQTSREAWALNHMGDRASLDLFGQQDELVDAIAATGTPIVALLFSGRPASVGQPGCEGAARSWRSGTSGRRAAGRSPTCCSATSNPGGKLPITIPRSVGHIPAFYNHKPSARRGYLFESAAPLFAFGYGLSYTTFAFSSVRLERADDCRVGESARVLVDVANTGARAGDEVVQLYVRDLVSSATRPVKELKGFRARLAGAGRDRRA